LLLRLLLFRLRFFFLLGSASTSEEMAQSVKKQTMDIRKIERFILAVAMYHLYILIVKR